mgnify:CR=1 FL=1|jgi:hypothetical protein
MLTALENDIIKRVSKADQDGVIYITAEEFVELYSDKKINLEHYLDKDNSEWVYKMKNQPIKLDGDKLTIGDMDFDATHIELITRYSTAKIVPGDEKHVLTFMTILMAYGDQDRFTSFDRGHGYMVWRIVCRAWPVKKVMGFDFDGKYAAAECGTVLKIHHRNQGSVKGGKQWATPMQPGLSDKKPYYIARLTDKTGVSRSLNLHKLIAVVFIKNDDPLNKTEVNHLDLNPLNNAIDNLEWCTKEHNMKYSTVFHALEKALPNIDCHEWISTCREITDKVVENGEDKTTLVAMAAVEINNKHLAAAS